MIGTNRNSTNKMMSSVNANIAKWTDINSSIESAFFIYFFAHKLYKGSFFSESIYFCLVPAFVTVLVHSWIRNNAKSIGSNGSGAFGNQWSIAWISLWDDCQLSWWNNTISSSSGSLVHYQISRVECRWTNRRSTSLVSICSKSRLYTLNPIAHHSILVLIFKNPNAFLGKNFMKRNR